MKDVVRMEEEGMLLLPFRLVVERLSTENFFFQALFGWLWRAMVSVRHPRGR